MKKSFLWPTEIYNFKSETIDNDKMKEIILEKDHLMQGKRYYFQVG